MVKLNMPDWVQIRPLLLDEVLLELTALEAKMLADIPIINGLALLIRANLPLYAVPILGQVAQAMAAVETAAAVACLEATIALKVLIKERLDMQYKSSNIQFIKHFIDELDESIQTDQNFVVQIQRIMSGAG
jgi:hypothetical protein